MQKQPRSCSRSEPGASRVEREQAWQRLLELLDRVHARMPRRKKSAKAEEEEIPIETFQRRVYLVRGQKGMLDSDCATCMIGAPRGWIENWV